MKEPVEIIEGATGQFVEAELFDEITVEHFLETKKLWRPLVLRAAEKLRAQGRHGMLPDYTNWDWTKKEPYLHMLATKFFGINCRKALQGIVVVQTENIAGDCQCRLSVQRGKSLLYVDYLQVAPWNIKVLMEPIGEKVEFRAVGSRLMEAVIRFSLEEGFKGRIGLHSLPSSEAFYKDECGMTPVVRDPRKQNLLWFEFTPDQAQAYLAGEIL